MKLSASTRGTSPEQHFYVLQVNLSPGNQGHVNETKNSSLLRRENTSAQETLPLFVHIPKTAGTSIWAALGPSYSDSNRYPEVGNGCIYHLQTKDVDVG